MMMARTRTMLMRINKGKGKIVYVDSLTMHVLSALQVDLRALLEWPMDIPVVIFLLCELMKYFLLNPETVTKKIKFIIEMRVYTDAT